MKNVVQMHHFSMLIFNRYTEVANNVQSRDTLTTVQFVLTDCAPLKNALVVHCLQWQAKLTGA